jgi:hypothetical protein
MRFQVYVTLEHESGPVQDEETMLDAFCGTLGEQNGALEKAARVTVEGWGPQGEELAPSVYVVKLVDDRPVG